MKSMGLTFKNMKVERTEFEALYALGKIRVAKGEIDRAYSTTLEAIQSTRKMRRPFDIAKCRYELGCLQKRRSNI